MRFALIIGIAVGVLTTISTLLFTFSAAGHDLVVLSRASLLVFQILSHSLQYHDPPPIPWSERSSHFLQILFLHASTGNTTSITNVNSPFNSTEECPTSIMDFLAHDTSTVHGLLTVADIGIRLASREFEAVCLRDADILLTTAMEAAMKQDSILASNKTSTGTVGTVEEPASTPVFCPAVTLKPTIYVSESAIATLRDDGPVLLGGIALVVLLALVEPLGDLDTKCKLAYTPWEVMLGHLKLAEEGGLAGLNRMELRSMVKSQFCEGLE